MLPGFEHSKTLGKRATLVTYTDEETRIKRVLRRIDLADLTSDDQMAEFVKVISKHLELHSGVSLSPRGTPRLSPRDTPRPRTLDSEGTTPGDSPFLPLGVAGGDSPFVPAELVEVDDSSAFLLTEFYPNGSLENYVTDDTLRHQSDVLRWIKQIMAGLDLCHNRLNLSHGNITLSNIFVDDNKDIKIGLSAELKRVLANPGTICLGDVFYSCEADQSKTVFHSISPTRTSCYTYCTPESLRSDITCQGHKQDIWALGVVTYQLAFSHFPFDTSDLFTVGRDVTTGNIRHMPENADPLLRKVIQRCLCVDPLRRPAIDELLHMVNRSES